MTDTSEKTVNAFRSGCTETYEHIITGLLTRHADLFNEAERIRGRLAEITNDIGAIDRSLSVFGYTGDLDAAMPRQKREVIFGNACELGQLVTIRCQFCRITRHYLLQNLRTLLGNVGVDQVEHRMRCGPKDYLAVAFHIPTAAEREVMRIRRVAGPLCAQGHLARRGLMALNGRACMRRRSRGSSGGLGSKW